MIRHYDIRHRDIEVSARRPEEMGVDAICLPWRPLDPEEEASGTLARAGLAVREEIADYREEREVMLTSGGLLPARFLFLLSMPAEGRMGAAEMEERFRDCLFQSTVLGLSELVIPINEFAPHAESFSQLVEALWMACREFLDRERAPQRFVFLVEERDLSGQYLRHFFQRKEAEERSWEAVEAGGGHKPSSPPPAAIPPEPNFASIQSVSPRTPSLDRRLLGDERVLTLDLDEEAAAAALDQLLAEYRRGAVLTEPLGRLEPLMREALAASLAPGENIAALPERLRVLGSDLVMRMPWELLRDEGSCLAERQLFTRGTNFLHFRTDHGGQRGRPFRLCFRVLGPVEPARGIAEELRGISESGKLGLKWATEEEASVRILHCLGSRVAEEMIERDRVNAELVFLELEPQAMGGGAARLEEWSRQLLAQGVRRVLAPLAAFRSEEERQLFRRAFYTELLTGMSVGLALKNAQEQMVQRLGSRSGWWLYRVFGQTDEALVPRAGPERRGRPETISS